MKNSCLIISLCVISIIANAQSTTKSRVLFGEIRKDSLLLDPFKSWFSQGYDEYNVSEAVLSQLSKANTKDISIDIFMGTWCGDSRREVPHFFKILDHISFPLDKVHMYGLGGFDSLYKQSPQHEENGKGIFRVPIYIVYRNGKEINRINEFPVISLEKDLLAILSGKNYVPNYKSFTLVNSWLSEGMLADKNTSIHGLAVQLKNIVESERELNNLGYVLVKQGKKQEALAIFRINATLYPESANVFSSLGEGYHFVGDDDKAVAFLERSLELNKDPQLVKEILKILYEVKGMK